MSEVISGDVSVTSERMAEVSTSEGDGAIVGTPGEAVPERTSGIEDEASAPVEERASRIFRELRANLPELVSLIGGVMASVLTDVREPHEDEAPPVVGTAIVLRPGAAGGAVVGQTPIVDLAVACDGQVLESEDAEILVDISGLHVDVGNRLVEGRRYRVLILADE